MAGFIAELKRRNVIRVALAYMAVARLLLQVVATVRSQRSRGDNTDNTGSEYIFVWLPLEPTVTPFVEKCTLTPFFLLDC